MTVLSELFSIYRFETPHKQIKNHLIFTSYFSFYDYITSYEYIIGWSLFGGSEKNFNFLNYTPPIDLVSHKN